MIKIYEGIHLHIIPTRKFKTVSVQFRFKTHVQADNITTRSLLANIMDVNSKLYPNQSEFRRRLSELYGANFYTDVSRYGNYHVVTLNMDSVDGEIVNEPGLFSDIMTFLKQVIFYPNISERQFHKPTFDREIDKLRDDYASHYDEKMTYAEDKLNDLYFETKEQKMTSYGQESDLDEITPGSLYESYLKMINEDQLDIFVIGNVTEEKILKEMEAFEFNPRSIGNADPFYENSQKDIFTEKMERQDINQTILTMGFQTPIYFHEQSYYIGILFNGLFGSMPHSKLFQTIREQNNLAYSISSEVDAYRGMILVYAGIESKEVDKVKALILNQLEEMQKGGFSEKDLELTKEVIKNEISQSDDTPHSIVEKAYNFSLICQQDLTIPQWIEKIDRISKNEVVDLACQINHRASFILIGEND